jgi:X-X-X-Leu-X-X-Gly heptad repeat protein
VDAWRRHRPDHKPCRLRIVDCGMRIERTIYLSNPRSELRNPQSNGATKVVVVRKSVGRKTVRVRVPPPAPVIIHSADIFTEALPRDRKLFPQARKLTPRRCSFAFETEANRLATQTGKLTNGATRLATKIVKVATSATQLPSRVTSIASLTT